MQQSVRALTTVQCGNIQSTTDAILGVSHVSQAGREGGRQARLSQQTSSVSLSEGLVVRGRAKASSGRAAISKLALTQLPRGATLLSFCGEDFKQRKKTGGDCIVGINNNGYKSAGSDNLEKVPSVRPVTKCPSLALLVPVMQVSN